MACCCATRSLLNGVIPLLALWRNYWSTVEGVAVTLCGDDIQRVIPIPGKPGRMTGVTEEG